MERALAINCVMEREQGIRPTLLVPWREVLNGCDSFVLEILLEWQLLDMPPELHEHDPLRVVNPVDGGQHGIHPLVIGERRLEQSVSMPRN